MSDVRKTGQGKGAVIVVAIYLVGMGCFSILHRGLLARQDGLSPAAALLEGISGGWRMKAAMMVGAVVMACAAALFLINRPVAGEGISPETAGSRLWRRMRLFATIAVLPFMLWTAGWVGYDLLAGKDLPEHVLIMLGVAACYAVLAIVYWIVKPSPEYLYVLGTGDRSRVDDERARDVKGRAAVDAIGLLLALVLLVGVPYDVLIRGALPIRSGAEAGAILLVWSLCSWRWNRKL